MVRPTVIPRAIDDARYRGHVPFISTSYNFFVHMHLAQSATFRARHQQLKEVGLTNAEFQLLLVVDGLGGSPIPADIARWMMRKPPTTTGLLHRMERNGLVRRIPDPNNRRLRRVVMTEKGEKALADGKERDITRAIMGSLTNGELEQLWSLLQKVQDAALRLIEEHGFLRG